MILAQAGRDGPAGVKLAVDGELDVELILKEGRHAAAQFCRLQLRRVVCWSRLERELAENKVPVHGAAGTVSVQAFVLERFDAQAGEVRLLGVECQ